MKIIRLSDIATAEDHNYNRFLGGGFFSKLEKILNEVFGFGEEVADHGLSPAEKTVKDNRKRIQEEIERRKNGGYLSGEDEEIFRKAPAAARLYRVAFLQTN